MTLVFLSPPSFLSSLCFLWCNFLCFSSSSTALCLILSQGAFTLTAIWSDKMTGSHLFLKRPLVMWCGRVLVMWCELYANEQWCNVLFWYFSQLEDFKEFKDEVEQVVILLTYPTRIYWNYLPKSKTFQLNLICRLIIYLLEAYDDYTLPFESLEAVFFLFFTLF